MNYQKYHEKLVFNALNDSFGLTMTVPPGFAIARQKKDFIWVRYETPEISQGIIVYTFPYISDSTFTENYLVAKTDSVLEINVPGPTAGSYMAVEKQIDQVLNIFEHNKNYTVEMRGLWRLENDFMGGPFVTYYFENAALKKAYMVDVFIHAPGTKKKPEVRRLEALLATIKFQ